MKKRISLILTAVLLLGSLAGCQTKPQAGNNAPADPYAHLRDAAMPNKLISGEVADFPIATDSMTYAQRRQLCLDFFQMQLSAQWKTNMDVSFMMSNYKKGTYKDLKTDALYGGIVYHSHGFGNLYRWLEYYDDTTGIMDMETALAENGGYGEGAAITHEEFDADGKLTYFKYRSLMAMGNQCTSSSCWSWGRVINSACFGDTCDLNIYNGFIPIGGYTYGYEDGGNYYGPLDIQAFGKKSETNPRGYDTPDVIADWNAKNGSDAMFKCYAMMKPGDCLVDEGHALMVKSVNLYTSKDGTVAYDLSTVTVLEQIEAWGQETTLNGVPFKNQGGVDRLYTFAQLQKDAYIPFTFLELLDENDPQDKQHLDHYYSYADKLVSVKNRYQHFTFTDEANGRGVEKAVTYCTHEGSTITPADLVNMVVGSNYSISDVFVTATDSTGAVLKESIFRAPYTNYREVSMGEHKSTWEVDEAGNLVAICEGFAPLANGETTLTVSMQLSTGEKLVAYTGTLVN